MSAADQQDHLAATLRPDARANRDAFRLCVIVLVVVALGLTVLGIAAWNSRFMLMPIVPREAPKHALSPRRYKHAETPLQTAVTPSLAVVILQRGAPRACEAITCRPVPHGTPAFTALRGYSAARIFAGTSDTAAPRRGAAQAAGLQSSAATRHCDAS